MGRDLELGQFRIFEKRSPIDYRQLGLPWLNDSLPMRRRRSNNRVTAPATDRNWPVARADLWCKKLPLEQNERLRMAAYGEQG